MGPNWLPIEQMFFIMTHWSYVHACAPEANNAWPLLDLQMVWFEREGTSGHLLLECCRLQNLRTRWPPKTPTIENCLYGSQEWVTGTAGLICVALGDGVWCMFFCEWSAVMCERPTAWYLSNTYSSTRRTSIYPYLTWLSCKCSFTACAICFPPLSCGPMARASALAL